MSRILITDDSMLQRNTLSAIVKDEGHEVETATNGREALEKIETNQPDILLLDMLMPELDGIGVLEALQAKGITLPIIVLTADVQEWLKARCFELGVTSFINKPVKQDLVRKALQEISQCSQHSEASCT